MDVVFKAKRFRAFPPGFRRKKGNVEEANSSISKAFDQRLLHHTNSPRLNDLLALHIEFGELPAFYDDDPINGGADSKYENYKCCNC